jgi:hypothetical protein
VTVTDLTTGVSISASNTNSGWTAGLGIEYGFNRMTVAWWDIETNRWNTDATVFAGRICWGPISL